MTGVSAGRMLMKVKMILPALTEAISPYFRPIKYSLFPPLGLATLAGYLNEDDQVTLQDEHVERLDLNDEPELVVIQVYITSAYRAYKLADHYRARGAYVALGGLHVTSLPDEAARHADSIFLGPGEDIWPAFLDDLLFGNPRFAGALFDGMRGMGRLWQAAGTVQAVLRPELLEKAVASGLRSLFVGFETLNPSNLQEQHKYQNLNRDYGTAIRRLHDLGVMVNGSFVFGMDNDDETVFDRTVEWAIKQGIETATFHILTPYPTTALYERMAQQERLLHSNWDLYDTRHVVYRPAKLTPEALEAGYWRAYRDFYRWSSIFQGAWTKERWNERLRHVAYATGWKKFEPAWDVIIRAKRASSMLPVLETILAAFGRHVSQRMGKEMPLSRKVEGRSIGGGRGEPAPTAGQ